MTFMTMCVLYANGEGKKIFMKDLYLCNLKKARENRGITQVRLSIELEIAQETISGYEIGRICPSIPMLLKIADYLNVSVDYLLGRTDNDIPSRKNISSIENQLLFDFKNLSEKNKKDLLWYLEALKNKNL